MTDLMRIITLGHGGWGFLTKRDRKKHDPAHRHDRNIGESIRGNRAEKRGRRHGKKEKGLKARSFQGT